MLTYKNTRNIQKYCVSLQKYPKIPLTDKKYHERGGSAVHFVYKKIPPKNTHLDLNTITPKLCQYLFWLNVFPHIETHIESWGARFQPITLFPLAVHSCLYCSKSSKIIVQGWLVININLDLPWGPTIARPIICPG